MNQSSCHRTRESEQKNAICRVPSTFRLQVAGKTREISLRQHAFSIGTGQQNHLVLADPYVSQLHCRLYRQKGQLWIHDQGSRNGTWVNNVRVNKSQLWAGAKIMLGRTVIQIRHHAPEEGAHGIVGEHSTMRRIFHQIQQMAPSSRPVLIMGETGTGKELVARALHKGSTCRLGPFEPLNCGAIPRELAEAELFGHAQGAFTGATRERKGAFERASGGTLFLDEVGEMPLELQPKILRVLEEGMIQRLGDERHRRVHVRLLAATHRDLLQEANQKRFRLDLYHRLAVGVITLPPLRARQSDIPLLVEHFLHQGSGELPLATVSGAALGMLKRQPWQGNVRELRNALHRATMEGEAALTEGSFSFLAESRGAGAPSEAAIHFLGRKFKDIQREVYQRVLTVHGGNRSAAAMALGIPKSTFFDHLRQLGIS